MSSVVVTGLKFDALANAQYRRHPENGWTFANTTEAIG